MTFTELAQELLKRCGEGYQDYELRAKEHLRRAFDDLILKGMATEDEYYGLIAKSEDIAFLDKILVFDDIATESENIVKITAVVVDGVKLDQLNIGEFLRSAEIGDFIGFCYHYLNGEISFINVPTAERPEGIVIYYVRRFIDVLLDDLNKTFTDSFMNKALDYAMPLMYNEINA